MTTSPHSPGPPTSAKLRLLIVAWDLQAYGGLETRLLALTRAVAAVDGYVTLVSARPFPNADWVRLIRNEGCRLISIQESWTRTASGRASVIAGYVAAAGRGRRPELASARYRFGHRAFLRHLSTFWEGAGLHLISNADVVHLVGSPKQFLVDTLRAVDRHGTPATYQSVHHVTAEYAARPHFSEFIEACNLCRVIFTTHDEQASDFRRHFGYRGSTLTIPQWSFESETELLSIRRRTRGGGPLRIGALCRLDSVKGLDTLIAATKRLLTQGVDCEVVIGGSGHQADILGAQAESLGIADRIIFSGYVENRAEFLGSLDAFVISSQAEGGPITGVEAMAAGLPIVTTPVGAMPERLSSPECGLFFNINDDARLAAQLARLAGDEGLRIELGNRARAVYCARYHSSLHKSRMIGALQRLAVDKTAPS